MLLLCSRRLRRQLSYDRLFPKLLVRLAVLVLLSSERQKSTEPYVPPMCTVPLRNSLRKSILVQVLWLPMELAWLPKRLPKLLALAGNRLSRPQRRHRRLHQIALRHRGV